MMSTSDGIPDTYSLNYPCTNIPSRSIFPELWWINRRSHLVSSCRGFISRPRDRAVYIKQPDERYLTENCTAHRRRFEQDLAKMLYAWLYVVLMIVNMVQMVSQIYFVVLYTDLERGYAGPIEVTAGMQTWIPTEAIAQAAITIVLLLFGEWLSFLITLPLLAWNVRQYQKGHYQIDATNIFRTLGGYKVEAFVKLGYYFLLFCYFLFSMIWYLVVHSDID